MNCEARSCREEPTEGGPFSLPSCFSLSSPQQITELGPSALAQCLPFDLTLANSFPSKQPFPGLCNRPYSYVPVVPQTFPGSGTAAGPAWALQIFVEWLNEGTLLILVILHYILILIQYDKSTPIFLLPKFYQTFLPIYSYTWISASSCKLRTTIEKK